MNERENPQNLEAERAVLGACMIDKAAIIVAAAALCPEDFYLGSHQKTFEAVLAIFNQGEEVDAITVDAFLKSEKNRPPTSDLLAMVEDVIPSHSREHIRIVKADSERRAIIGVLEKHS